MRATLIPGSPKTILIWSVDGTMERGENFNEWDVAIARAEEVRLELLADGWIDPRNQ
jgi:hypothetical protein